MLCAATGAGVDEGSAQEGDHPGEARQHAWRRHDGYGHHIAPILVTFTLDPFPSFHTTCAANLRACCLCVCVCRSLPDGPAGVGHGQADTRGGGGARGHTGTNIDNSAPSL